MIRLQSNEKKNYDVSIYHNTANKNHIITLHLDIKAPYQNAGDIIGSISSRIRDLYDVKCQIRNNPDRKFILITIHIVLNVSIRNIILFIDKGL